MPKRRSPTRRSKPAAKPPAPSALQQVNVKLFTEDVSDLRQRAAKEGANWSVKLRALVRAALRPPTLRAYKFLVPSDRFVKVSEEHAYKGCVAVAVATSEERAREAVKLFAAERGRDVRWLEVAQVHVIEIRPDVPTPLAFAMI